MYLEVIRIRYFLLTNNGKSSRAELRQSQQMFWEDTMIQRESWFNAKCVESRQKRLIFTIQI